MWQSYSSMKIYCFIPCILVPDLRTHCSYFPSHVSVQMSRYPHYSTAAFGCVRQTTTLSKSLLKNHCTSQSTCSIQNNEQSARTQKPIWKHKDILFMGFADSQRLWKAVFYHKRNDCLSLLFSYSESCYCSTETAKQHSGGDWNIKDEQHLPKWTVSLVSLGQWIQQPHKEWSAILFFNRI